MWMAVVVVFRNVSDPGPARHVIRPSYVHLKFSFDQKRDSLLFFCKVGPPSRWEDPSSSAYAILRSRYLTLTPLSRRLFPGAHTPCCTSRRST